MANATARAIARDLPGTVSCSRWSGHRKPRLLRRDDAVGVVGGPVVHHDDLVAGLERLDAQVIQAFVEQRGAVVRRDDDGDARRLTHHETLAREVLAALAGARRDRA